jgi:hypothetical protein
MSENTEMRETQETVNTPAAATDAQGQDGRQEHMITAAAAGRPQATRTRRRGAGI